MLDLVKDESDHPAESDQFWTLMGRAAEDALKRVSLSNPDRLRFECLSRDCHAAAGLPLPR